MSMLTRINMIGIIVMGQKRHYALTQTRRRSKRLLISVFIVHLKNNLLETDKIHSMIIWTRQFY